MNYFQTLEERITEKIRNITRALDSDLFMSKKRREKFYKEMENLLKKREKLKEILKVLFPNEKYR